jgi:hypothetical protein
MLRTAACALVVTAAHGENWYTESFYLLHEDHHTQGRDHVGRDLDAGQLPSLLALSRPDVIQIHAKGNPGWTTYPSKVGHTPPLLARDVLAVWRDVARREKYHFSVYYNLGRDGVIMARQPEWNRVDAGGKPVDRALCYHSGVAEGYLWPMIHEILEGYHPDGFWFDGSCFTVRVCYCAKCRDRFQREHGRTAPREPTQPGWTDYKEMQRQIYREFVQETAARIHAIDPACLVAVNFAYSLRMPEKPAPGIAWLTGDYGNQVERLSAEAHWYDSQLLPFDLMTQLNTLGAADEGGGEASSRMVPKPAVQIQQEMAVIIANGGRYFVWDSPTPESGLLPRRMEILGSHVAPFLRARQKWCLGTTRVPDVSLLHSAKAHYGVTEDSPAVFALSDNRIDGATDWLTRLHLNYEMIPDWRLDERDIRSPLLIVEHPKILDEETVASLIQFVSDGGQLLITGMGLTRDARLRELCGIGECPPAGQAEPLRVTLSGEEIALSHWLFRTRLAGASPLLQARDKNDRSHPLLTGNTHGRGQAFYAAIPLLSHHGENAVPESLVRAVLDRVRPPEQRHLTVDAPATVEAVLRRKDNVYLLHLVNMDLSEREIHHHGGRGFVTIRGVPKAPACHVSIRLPGPPRTVTLQPEGTKLTTGRFENSRWEAEIPSFQVHQIVEIQQRDDGR